jgi:hypothetical protein
VGITVSPEVNSSRTGQILASLWQGMLSGPSNYQPTSLRAACGTAALEKRCGCNPVIIAVIHAWIPDLRQQKRYFAVRDASLCTIYSEQTGWGTSMR